MVMRKQSKGVERREGKEEKGEEREGPPLSADKRQKWMNPIGRRASFQPLISSPS